jgi:hypothetical protein
VRCAAPVRGVSGGLGSPPVWFVCGGQAAAAGNSSRAWAGVFRPGVLRGLLFGWAATASGWSLLCTGRLVSLGKYWRGSLLVFLLLPCCQGECGSQK